MADGYKLGQLILGVLFLGIIITSLMLFITDTASKNDLDFDNETLNKYNQYNEMIELSESIKDNESDMQTRGGLQDILGDWFEQGYKTLRASRVAVESTDDIINSAGEDAGMGNIGTTIMWGLGAAIFLIATFIIISTLTNREQI